MSYEVLLIAYLNFLYKIKLTKKKKSIPEPINRKNLYSELKSIKILSIPSIQTGENTSKSKNTKIRNKIKNPSLKKIKS